MMRVVSTTAVCFFIRKIISHTSAIRERKGCGKECFRFGRIAYRRIEEEASYVQPHIW